MNIKLKFTRAEYDMILAGLRMLAIAIDNGQVHANDGDVSEVITNSGEHPMPTSDDVHDLADALQDGEHDA
jgi:hypothetical protein